MVYRTHCTKSKVLAFCGILWCVSLSRAYLSQTDHNLLFYSVVLQGACLCHGLVRVFHKPTHDIHKCIV